MPLVRRERAFLLNSSTSDFNRHDGSWTMRVRFSAFQPVLQDVPAAVCYRCKQATRRGDHLVHVECNSEDTLKPETIYHYRCIPPARWHKLAGSLPAWELPSDESPAENAGTSSAADPTH